MISLKNEFLTQMSYFKTERKRKLIKISRSLRGKKGIEIGGPSPNVFGLRKECPLYIYAKVIDGINFHTNTVWEGKLVAGQTFNYFEGKVGHQFIAEGSSLPEIEGNKYDFLLSSHNLEHIANPIKALLEWNRILKQAGKLILVLPNKMETFDRKRPYSTFEHLVDDWKNNTGEDDQTHLTEILKYTEFTNEPLIDVDAFRDRLANNYETRIAHHHVFDFELVEKILKFTGFRLLYQQKAPPNHLFNVAEKL
jgi:SAM-dependent methyltransferase